MALSRRSSARFQSAIWPGFVDAMTGLLLVLMFVLTIFMVIQFVLRETISGQATELDALSEEIISLSSSLGIANDLSASLTSDLDEAATAADAQTALIATLTADRDAQVAALNTAQNQITGFEAQVAGLLSDQAQANEQISNLTADRADLISEADAMNIALAQARNEIDAGVEAARLAAARREALESFVAELETTNQISAERIASLEAQDIETTAQLSEAEAARLAEAAAAEALRARLAGAGTELTAMTLSLEAKRREAEETLTLLAAAEAARETLDRNLAAALLAQQALQTDLTTAQEGQGLSDEARDTLEQRLTEALLANEGLQTQVNALTAGQSETAQGRATLQAELAEALAAISVAENTAITSTTAAQRQASLLATANAALSEEQALSAESRRQVALLNAQVSELRQQVGNLQSLLNLAEDADLEANVQIEALGSQLNTALARVAAEERRRRALEEVERTRLEEEAVRLQAEAQNLERFRSDFFGQVREVLEGQDRVKIEGDRFVFSSEVLFQPGRAELSELGRGEIANIASILRGISDDIPAGIDWVIRVDGHTDNLPLSGNGRYRDNWELSQARALSVVQYMVNFLGIPPERLAANGFGQFQPLNTADTPDARAQNRRIELKLTER